MRESVLAIAIVIVSATAAHVFAQTPVSYPPALEGQLWKQILPWGLNKDANNQTIWAARQDLNNKPSTLKEYAGWTDPLYGDPLYRSVRINDPRWTLPSQYGHDAASSLLAADVQFDKLAVGECTFSHGDDYDIGYWIYWPQVRYCKGANNEKLPPAPGKLLNPVGIALSKNKVYVSDLFNHRIQVFDFYGNVIPVKFPIGNGVPGTGRYSYPNYQPYGATFDGGFSGHQVTAPYGIALDGHQVGGVPAPRLLVADSGNYRIAIFNEDGSPAFGTDAAPVHATLPVPKDPAGVPLTHETFKPDLVAVSKNAVVLPPGTVIAQADPNKNERIVVTDRVHCYIQILDPAFNVIKSMPLANPVSSQHHGCLEGEDGTVAQPYEFSTVTGVQIADNGNIFVADHAQNSVQVFDRNGQFITFIGRPGGGNPGGAGNLRGPVGLLIDGLGRLGVIDAGNARAVFFDISNGPQNATFVFQIGITLSVEDFPMGLAFQVGPKTEGLDPQGRILVTDPLRRRLLRFELPEIVIANATASITRPDLNPKEGVASFDVVVPFQKRSPVNGVIVTIAPQVPASVQIKPGTVVPSLATRPNIQNGQLVHYTFQFTSSIPEVKFDITARGECDQAGNNCLAKQVQAPAIARAPCATCSATHKVYEDPEAPEGPIEAVPIDTADRTIDGRVVGGWYDRTVFVRIEPVTPPSTPANDPKRIVSIEWSYGGISGLLAGAFTNVVDTTQEGSFIDVPVNLGGLSWVTYRAISFEGSASAPVEVLLPLDLLPPTIRFTNWTPRSGTDFLRDWHNQPVVTGTYEVLDDESGPAAPAVRTVTFTAETMDQVAAFTVFDQIGRSADRNSLEATAGRKIHIDRHAPIFYDTGELTFTTRMTGVSGVRRFATLAAGAFKIEASDPPLPSGAPGSRTPQGRFLVDSAAGQFFDGDSITFTATDYAGNSTVKTAKLRVETVVPTVSLTGGTFTYDGVAHPAVCQVAGVGGVPAVGVVTYAPGGTTVPKAAGTYNATCRFLGDNNYPASADAPTAVVQIDKRKASITANDNSKSVNRPDPVPLTTFTTSNFVASDGLTFSVSREAGETVRSYVITPAVSGAAKINYDITYNTGVFRIVDNAPPVCTGAYGGEIWPPNHKKFYVAPIKGVTDPEGQAITIVVTGIWQDEPIDSTGDGKFSPDGQGVGTATASVRAERAGNGNKATGNGRVYEILFTAKDTKNATCSGSVLWTVPHDQGQGSTAIDSGVRYDSTGVIPGARDKSQIHQKSPLP